jgi:hypothetical protein
LARHFASNNTLPLLADVKQARRMFGGLSRNNSGRRRRQMNSSGEALD